MIKNWLPVLSRYTVIGVLSVLANNVILIAGEMIGLHYAVSSVVCFLVIGALAYVAHAQITFSAESTFIGYLRYCGTQLFGLVLTLALLAAMIDLLEWQMWIAAPVLSVAMLVYTFIATRWAVLYKARSR